MSISIISNSQYVTENLEVKVWMDGELKIKIIITTFENLFETSV